MLNLKSGQLSNSHSFRDTLNIYIVNKSVLVRHFLLSLFLFFFLLQPETPPLFRPPTFTSLIHRDLVHRRSPTGPGYSVARRINSEKLNMGRKRSIGLG